MKGIYMFLYFIFERKGYRLVVISKEEKDKLLARFPDLYIVRTMRGESKRHRYYCEEKFHVMRYLDELRGKKPAADKRGGDRYQNRKKTRRN